MGTWFNHARKEKGVGGSAGHPSAIPRLPHPIAPKAGALGAPVRSGLRQNRAGFLEKREKWRTPSYFGHCLKTDPGFACNDKKSYSKMRRE